MTTTKLSGWVARLLLLMGMVSSAGCTEYRVYFDCDKKINTAVFKTEGAPLDIDILAVTNDEMTRSPELATMTGQELVPVTAMLNVIGSVPSRATATPASGKSIASRTRIFA